MILEGQLHRLRLPKTAADEPQPLLDLLQRDGSGALAIGLLASHPAAVQSPERYMGALVNGVCYAWLRNAEPPKEVRRTLQRSKSKALGAHNGFNGQTSSSGGGVGGASTPSTSSNQRVAVVGGRNGASARSSRRRAAEEVDAADPQPEQRAPRRRDGATARWWFPVDAPELVDAIESWRRFWHTEVPVWVVPERDVVRARRSRGEWRVAGDSDSAFGHFDNAEQRRAFLEVRPAKPERELGPMQSKVMAIFDENGDELETSVFVARGIPAPAALRALHLLRESGMVRVTVTTTKVYPSQRALVWSRVSEEEEVAAVEPAEEEEGSDG